MGRRGPKPTRTQLLFRVAYRGEPFHGVPPQPGLPTVGEALFVRVHRAAGQRPRAMAWAARTDSGVHADENFATMWVPDLADPDRLCAEVAAPAGDHLGVVALRVVPEHCYARAIARAKTYRYRLRWGEGVDPDRAWVLPGALDLDAVRAGAAPLLGTHDFRSFAIRHPPGVSPVRTLEALRVEAVPGGADLVVVGTGFLRRMVRIIVGTLVHMGEGERAPETMLPILEARDRPAAGPKAPPTGLSLERVHLVPEARALAGPMRLLAVGATQ